MKTTVYYAVICLLLAIISCKEENPIVEKRQKIFDEIQGNWVISEVSETYWKRILANTKKNFAFDFKKMKKDDLIGSTLSFVYCDSKKYTDASPCKGSAVVAGTNCNLYYSYEDRLVFYSAVPTAVGTSPNQEQLEVIYALSVPFDYEVSATQLKLIYKTNEITDNEGIIILKKK